MKWQMNSGPKTLALRLKPVDQQFIFYSISLRPEKTHLSETFGLRITNNTTTNAYMLQKYQRIKRSKILDHS